MVERFDQTVVATFFSSDPFLAGGHVSLGDDAAQHARVIRIGPGERVALRDGAGCAASGVLARMTKRSLTVDVDNVWEIPAPAPVHMLVPIADRDRMLMLAEKATELGATSWRPVAWRRSKSVEGRGEGPTFVGRIRSRMISALAQSGGGWLPEIHPSASVPRAIAAAPEGSRILLDASSAETMMSLNLGFPLVIALGPEGGLADDERQQMIDGGFTPVRIAPAVLRFETAGVAALAIAMAVADLSAHPAAQPSP
ncbi:MAG: RsmE family RNA methyltransferase [Gemmatimonadales bacterium]